MSIAPHCAGRRARGKSFADLTFCELFCGRAALSRAFEQQGHQTFRYDVRIDRAMNIHTPQGLLTASEALARVDPDKGVVHCSPTCGSWTWINFGTSLRGIETCL